MPGVVQNIKNVVLVGMHARASADNQRFVIGCSVEHPYTLRFCNTLLSLHPNSQMLDAL